jgi:hypothetical protein
LVEPIAVFVGVEFGERHTENAAEVFYNGKFLVSVQIIANIAVIYFCFTHILLFLWVWDLGFCIYYPERHTPFSISGSPFAIPFVIT